MKKIIRLTESDLVELVKQVINEQTNDFCTPNLIPYFKVIKGTATNLEKNEKLNPQSYPFGPKNKNINFLKVDEGSLVKMRYSTNYYEVGPGIYNCKTLVKSAKPIQQQTTSQVQSKKFTSQPGTTTR
jgi:hypothetical protein